MKIYITTIISLSVVFSQNTLIHDGIERSYLITYPPNATEPTPLIINMHGYGSNAFQQKAYSLMDVPALAANITVVYPNGINSSWNVGTNWDGNDQDDVGFINALIDTVAALYSIDLDRVYACGMSNGGYMAYELACEAPEKIAAFGSVTGNFMLNSNQTCQQDRLIPFIDFHGTSDVTVPYFTPYDGSFSVSESIDYYSNLNDLTVEIIEQVPNIYANDFTTAEKYTYSSENHSVEFVHFKIYGGGHQWFGSTLGDYFITDLGYNNHDISTNDELIDFFLNYRLSDFDSISGDVNGDGALDVIDIVIIVNMILSNEFNAMADYNGDGSLNVLDVVFIVQSILEN